MCNRLEFWELDTFCLSNLRERLQYHSPQELWHREHRASKAVHPGKWRETMDSHFVRIMVEWGRREGFKKVVASKSQSKAKLCCSCQQKVQSWSAAVQQKLGRLGRVQHCASLLQAEATVQFCQFGCCQGGSPWEVGCTYHFKIWWELFPITIIYYSASIWLTAVSCLNLCSRSASSCKFIDSASTLVCVLNWNVL